jgi:ferric-dicitrate binding protein FerR (iron transport regulator)
MSDWWATAHVPLFASEMRENFATRLSPLLKKQNGSARSLFGNAWFKAAASLLLLISFSVAFYYVGRKTAVQPEEMAWFETVTPYGAQSKVVLPDKSVVWINAGSSLKYNKSFNKINREVYLEGEAYFEVSHDSLKPFIVKSDALDVKVLGTRFNVKAYENDQTVDVCLISGKVDVHFNEEASALPNVIMKPNQLVSYHRSSSTMDLK